MSEEKKSEVTHHKTAKNTQDYNSNPFTLSFNALGKFFTHNANWAIAIVALSFFGMMFQFLGNIGDLASQGSTTTTPQSYDTFSTAATSSTEVTTIIAIVIFVFVIALFFGIIAIVISTYLQGMFSYAALKSETEERRVGLGEAFDATTKRFWRLFGAQLLAGIKIFGWTLLLIIPGIIAALRYRLLSFVIMSEPETEKGIGASHNTTKAVVKGRLMEVFGVGTVSSLIPIIGPLLGLTGNAALYSQLDYYHKKKLEKPKVHWLNYVGLFIIGFIMLFATFIGALLIVFITYNS